MRRIGAILLVGAVTLLASACSSVSPVKSGRQGLLDHWAGLEEVGEDHSHSASRDAEDSPEMSASDLASLKGSTRGWRWPLQQVHVTSPFGRRGHDFHEGIDLRAKSGTPVYSVDAGKVIYSGRRLRGYGKMVIVRHASGLSSVYAHNSRLLVSVGQKVKRGQTVSVSGASGHVSGPHLHFEVRRNDTPLDPQRLIQASRHSFASSK